MLPVCVYTCIYPVPAVGAGVPRSGSICSVEPALVCESAWRDHVPRDHIHPGGDGRAHPHHGRPRLCGRLPGEQVSAIHGKMGNIVIHK